MDAEGYLSGYDWVKIFIEKNVTDRSSSVDISKHDMA